MINKYVSEIALQMGMKLSNVALVDGRTLGCRDVCMLNITSHGCIASALIFPTDLLLLENGVRCDQLEVRMRAALSRLQMQLDA